MKLPFRTHQWYFFVLPPIAGVGLLAIAINQIPFEMALGQLGYIMLSATATAAFGFFINDWGDIAEDALAGKPNMVQKLPPLLRVLVLCLLFAIIILPWMQLPKNPFNIYFLILQHLLLMVYALPPFRFKKFKVLAVLIDALYSGTLYYAIVLFTLIPQAYFKQYEYIIILILMVHWGFIKGLRNILLHQISDTENDLKSGNDTLSKSMGNTSVLEIIQRNLILLEALFSGLLHLLLFIKYFTLLPLLVWAMYHGMYVRNYYLQKSKNIGLSKETLFAFNDYHEIWLPLAWAAQLSVHYENIWALVLLCIVFFRIPYRLFKKIGLTYFLFQSKK